MPTALIAYATTHGHTAKICRRIAEVLRAAGTDVDLAELATAADDADPAAHDGTIVAASIHRGTHQHEVVDWIERNRASLAEHPSALVSVSLTAAEDTDEAREVTAALCRDLSSETGWTPTRTLAAAGALQYREYDFFTRTLMRLLMRRGGHPTDASQDYDYTDWDAVDRFATDFNALLTPTG
ncbi:MAG: protoporphyrinogen oxidase [Solirubrobacterales bacterium]|nr:protoporphyrinogen oxidase [Solirubrobacterales bacterium]